MLILPCRIGLQVLMHGLGGNPRISQWRLELRIGLALRFDQRMDLRDESWMQLFGLVSATS